MISINFYKRILGFVFMVIVVQAVGQKNITKPSIRGPEGYKVNSFSGALFYNRQDFMIESIGPDLDFKFTYVSTRRKKEDGFGYGWKFTYHIYYEIDDQGVIAVQGTEGGKKSFFLDGNEYKAEKGVFDVLEEYDTGKFKMTSKDGTQYFFDDPIYKKVTGIEDRCENGLSLVYTDSLLTTITDHTGRSISLNWDNGRLTNITNALVNPERSYSYSYNNNGNMVLYTDPMGQTIEYGYDDNHRLILVVDQNSTPTRIAYLKSGGVKKIASCDVELSISYNAPLNRTYVVQEVENDRHITTYQFDPNGNIASKKGNCCGYNVSYLYDDDNNVTKREDGNGNSTLYAFDDRGNPTAKTDALGNAEEFQYDNVFSFVSLHKDMNGSETNFQYDSKGNVTQILYPLNITESFTHDAFGNLTSFTDGNGNTTTHEYDAYGYMIKTIHPDSTFQESIHDAVGNLIYEINENGDTTHYFYDALDRNIKIRNALGYETNLIYDGVGNLIEMIDALGNSTTYVYDGLKRLVSETTAMGFTTEYTYDSEGNQTSVIDPMGNKTSFKYNIRGQLVEQTDALGNSNYFDYDASGNKISQSDKMGNFITIEYNELNQVERQTDPNGNSVQFEYDALGQKTKEIDPRGNVTSYEYDVMGRLIKMIDALGNFEEYEYDAAGNKISQKDKNGNIRTYTYNKRNQLRFVTNALQEVVEFRYDAVGNKTHDISSGITLTEYTYNVLNLLEQETSATGETLNYIYDSVQNIIQEINANGNITYTEYDADYRVTRINDPLGLINEYTYNANNRLLSDMSGDSILTTFEYDQLNRLIKRTNQVGDSEYFQYDANNHLIQQIDRNGNSSSFVYNNLGLVISATNELGHTTTFTHDPTSNLETITDSRGNTSTFLYDALNRRYASQFPDGNLKTYVFDANGNVIERINSDGDVMQMTYDALNRQVAKNYSDGTSCIFHFDQLGRMTQANNPHANISFIYDMSGRLLSENINGLDSITFSYDIANNNRSITYPSGRVVEETLDARGRVSSVSQNGELVSSFGFDNFQMISQNFGNGLNTLYTFDGIGNIKSMTTQPNAVFQYEYDYDKNFNLTTRLSLHQPEYSQTFDYDQQSRLTSFNRGTISNNTILNPIAQMAFQYDALGNRESVTANSETTNYQTDAMNAYTSIAQGTGSINLQYSNTGNLILKNANTYEFDLDNRLLSIGSNVEYHYDALGRRIEKIVNGNSTKYFYALAQMIAEVDDQGVVTEYIYAGKNDYLLARIKENDIHYYHQNSLGSILGLSDENGEIVERYEYSPYGKVEYFDGEYNALTTSTLGNRILYTGKELDEESGFYYFRSRHYDPDLGRFIQRDPLQYEDGMNMYQYVLSNPVNFVDQYGLLSACVKLGYSKKLGGSETGILRKIGGLTGGQKNSTSFTISVSGSKCNACCEETKTEGTKLSWKASLSGSYSQQLNALVFFPPARGIVIMARAANIELLVGGEVSATLSGSVSLSRSACGEENAQGCVSFSAKVFVGIRVKGGQSTEDPNGKYDRFKERKKNKKPKASVKAGGGVDGSASISACYSAGNGWKCKAKLKADFVAFIQVEATFLGASFTIKEDWNRTIIDESSNRCPPFLPTPGG